MTLTVVQSKTGTGRDATLTFASGVTAGNLIVATQWAWTSGTPFTTPTATSNTFHKANSVEHSGDEAQVAIWYAYNAVAVSIISIGAGGPADFYWQITEVHSDQASFTGDPIDVIPTLTDDDSSPVALSSGTLAQAAEILFGVLSWNNGDGATVTPSGLTNSIQKITSQTIQAGSADYQIVAATTAVNYSTTITGVSFTDGIMVVASFKEPAAAGGGQPTRKRLGGVEFNGFPAGRNNRVGVY